MKIIPSTNLSQIDLGSFSILLEFTQWKEIIDLQDIAGTIAGNSPDKLYDSGNYQITTDSDQGAITINFNNPEGLRSFWIDNEYLMVTLNCPTKAAEIPSVVTTKLTVYYNGITFSKSGNPTTVNPEI